MSSIKDVAKLAGVSPGTVSKVINKYDTISKETSDKVNKAIEELNYIPNQVASNLAKKNKLKIGLLVFVNNQKQAIDEINMQYILGATDIAHSKNIETTIIFSTTFENMNCSELIRYLHSRSITSLIIYQASKRDETIHELINTMSFPTIVVDADFVNKSTGCVTVNHYNGQFDVLNKIYSLNKPKNLLYIAGREDGYVTEQRLNAARDFAKENNIKITVKHGDFSEKKAYDITMKYYKGHDVISCGSDLMAIGAQKALKKLDLFIPITGYDGISLMGYAASDIWTVSQDFYFVSKQALIELLKIIDGELPKITLIDYEIKKISYTSVVF